MCCAVMGACLLLLACAWALPAQAQDNDTDGTYACEDELEAADQAYVNSEYGDAVALAAECIDREDVTDDTRVAAYRVMGLAYLRQDRIDRARDTILRILSLDPTYQADPVDDPPSYTSLVTIVRREAGPTLVEGQPIDAADPQPEDDRTPFFRRASTWVTIGGIAVSSGIATFFVLMGDDDPDDPPPTGPEPLPPPPSPP